ncbi:MAG: hypothetical protein ACR2NW_08105 [Thermodesulfobacteriota bacterium]
MKKTIFLICVFILTFFVSSAYSKENKFTKHMAENPNSYIKIHDYSVYGTWGAVAILHNIVIENTSDISYENIKIRICYNSISSPGNIISQEVGVIPITLPPNSKNTYLNAGMPFGGGTQSMNAVDIQVLGAEVAN